MDKINRHILTGVIASESIHVFCCVLPMVFSLMSLLIGVAGLPLFVIEAHHLIHRYELPMIVVSAIILGLSWGVYALSRKLNCQTEGTCCHTPCTPKKDRTKIVMVIATLLFIGNVAIYLGFHKDMDENFTFPASHAIDHNHGSSQNHD